MNYGNLVKQVAQSLNMSQTEADKFVKGFMKVILDALQDNDSVDLSGFGKFKKVVRKARTGVNPKNPSEKINIPESKALTFKQAAAVKRMLNEK